MKNKKLTYILIAVVIAVWGMILYRVFDTVGDSDDTPVTAVVPKDKEPLNDYAIQPDTTHLLLNYRDPFGLTKQKDTAVKIIKPLALRRIIVVPKPAMSWSFITYSGYVRNPASKRLIALLSINGQNVTLAEGETKSQVKLLKNFRDSVKVSYQGKTKFIAIKSAAL